METPYTLIVVCSVVLIQLWLPVAYSRPEMSEMQVRTKTETLFTL